MDLALFMLIGASGVLSFVFTGYALPDVLWALPFGMAVIGSIAAAVEASQRKVSGMRARHIEHYADRCLTWCLFVGGIAALFLSGYFTAQGVGYTLKMTLKIVQ
ncbi:MAG: hypothetical protein WAX89_00885 [Alphaproteobacteria bacterium]